MWVPMICTLDEWTVCDDQSGGGEGEKIFLFRKLKKGKMDLHNHNGQMNCIYIDELFIEIYVFLSYIFSSI